MPTAARTLSQLLKGETRFGRLTVQKEGTPKTRNGRQARHVDCVCDCGKTVSVHYSSLIDGRTKSCGCWASEGARQRAAKMGVATRKHGQATDTSMTAEYHAWTALKYRCGTPTAPNYHNYGGRGIQVCIRWRDSFEAFFADMGPRPSPHHSIDRINNDGNYEPGNCRWATATEQQSNRRVSQR